MKSIPAFLVLPAAICVHLILCAPATAVESAESPAPLSATAIEEITAHDGQEVAIEGLVASTRINNTGIHFLEFADTTFVCVTFAQNLPAFGDAPPAATYKGKWVRVRGKVEQFRASPQIRLLSPEQIEVLPDRQPAAPPSPAPVAASTPAPAPAVKAPPSAPVDSEVEVVEGVPALDWRKYFPPAKP